VDGKVWPTWESFEHAGLMKARAGFSFREGPLRPSIADGTLTNDELTADEIVNQMAEKGNCLTAYAEGMSRFQKGSTSDRTSATPYGIPRTWQRLWRDKGSKAMGKAETASRNKNVSGVRIAVNRECEETGQFSRTQPQ